MFATVKRSRGVDGVGGYDTNVDVSPSLQHKSKQLKTDKEYEFIRHIRDLNKSLQTFFKKQISNNAIADLSLAAQVIFIYTILINKT